MRFGVAMRVRYDGMRDVAQAADELGYESIWLPEHLIWPADLGGLSPHTGHGPGVDPTIPTLDTLMWMVTLAQATTRVRLGTYVYNLALRHPLVAARAVQTLDVISGGRVEFGVGAGWSRGEYDAAGVDFASRGRRLDEAIAACRTLWRDETVTHEGEFFHFGPVVFEPKPPQGLVPISVGGESAAALARAGRLGDGWLGMSGSPEQVAPRAAAVRAAAAAAGRDPASVIVSSGGEAATPAEVAAYASAGVDRIIVAPWRRTADAVAGLASYADQVMVPSTEVAGA